MQFKNSLCVRRPVRLFLGLGILLTLAGWILARPVLLNRAPTDHFQSGSLITTDKKGDQRWQAKWTMERLRIEEQKILRFGETGKGVYSPFSKPVQWTLQADWLDGDRFVPLQSTKRIQDMRGNLLAVERRQFDWQTKTVRFVKEDGAGTVTLDTTLEVPTDILTGEGIAAALQNLPWDARRPTKAHLLTDEPKIYSVSFKITGREFVETATGPIECYKVKMDFNLGFLNLFKALIPDTHFWFSVEEPHFWVQYKGLESGRGTPEVTRRMTSFQRRQDPDRLD